MPKKRQRDAGFVKQPHVAKVLAALRSKRGATIDELSDGREPHTIRAIFSRLRSVAGVEVTLTRDAKRGNVYRAKGGAR